MKLEADSRVSFPRALVFSTYRDRLPELVPHLPNVRAITVEKREDGVGGAPGVTRMLNRWEAKGEIPKAAQAVIKPEMLAWLDHAVWDQDHWTVEWRIETRMFTENVKCFGKNRYLELSPQSTLLEIRGELTVDLKGIPGVPRLLAGAVAPAVERFVVALLTPNLISVAKGLEAFLRAEEGKKT